MAEAPAPGAVLMTRLVALMLLGAVASGCASGRAQVVEDQPTLVVPPVPPRSIEPPAPTQPPAIEPVPEIPPPSAPPAKPKPTVTRNTTEPKPESKQEAIPDSGTGVSSITSATPNPAPVAPLRTPTTPSGPEATKQVREILLRAEGLLSRVDYQKLSQDRRANYDTAKNWIQQADEALKKEDLTLARSFAERAENIAKQLEAGR